MDNCTDAINTEAAETENQTEAPIVYARAAADRGWRVYPVYGFHNYYVECGCGACHDARESGQPVPHPMGPCTCHKGPACPKPGKHPIPDNGFNDAVTDPTQIEEWHANHPTCNWGIATGPESGIWVLDVDGKKGAADLAALEAEHGVLPTTQTVETGSGGRHYYFRYPEDCVVNSPTKLHKTMIDVRGKGGGVVAPGSLHYSGRRYQIVDCTAPIPAPQWLLNWVMAEKAGANNRRRSTAARDDDDLDLTTLLDALDHVPREYGDQSRKNWLQVGMALHNGDDSEDALAAWIEWSTTGNYWNPDEECRKQWASFEDKDDGISVGTLLWLAGKNGWKRKGMGKRGPSATDQLIAMCSEIGAELFFSSDGDPLVTLPVGEGGRTQRIMSEEFGDYLINLYRQSTGKSVGVNTVGETQANLRAMARASGIVRPAFIRVGGGDSLIVIDLGSPDGSVIIVDADGWRVEARSPVPFLRTQNMLPLPLPERGGSVDELRPFVNVSDEDWPALLTWIMSLYRPAGVETHTLLALYGPHGAAKTTVTHTLRGLVDPVDDMTRHAPMTAHQAAIEVSQSWVLAYDNLDHVPKWLSDLLASMLTCGSFSVRAFHRDNETKTFRGVRPIIVNGIHELARHGDLLSRTIPITLIPLPVEKRMGGDEFKTKLTAAMPRILGALLDAISLAIRQHPETRLDPCRDIRLKNCVRWAVAAEPALGLPAGSIVSAYETRQHVAHVDLIANDPVGAAIMRMAIEWRVMHPETPALDCTATEWLEKVRRTVKESNRPERFPKNGRGMTAWIQRLIPSLATVGITVEDGRVKNRRFIRVTAPPMTDDEIRAAGVMVRPRAGIGRN